MKNAAGKSIGKKGRAVHKSVRAGKNTNLKKEINTPYSFPEFNPNPVIEMDLKFNIHYINPAAKACLKGIQKQGINHPFLKNIKQIFLDLKNNKKEAIKREIRVDDTWFYQSFLFVESTNRVNIYAYDITGPKLSEERITHLNAVLRAIRDVNQLIVKEKDRGRLIQKACVKLIETRGYGSAWIALLDETGNFITSAEAGIGEKIAFLIEQLKRGIMPECGRRALAQSEAWFTNRIEDYCTTCPLAKLYPGNGGMSIRLEYEGKVYGFMTVSVPSAQAVDEEEKGLFREVSADIAFALHGLEAEAERKKAEANLLETEQLLQMIIDNIPALVSYIKQDRCYQFVNKRYAENFGKTTEAIIGKPYREIVGEAYYLSTVKNNDAAFSGQHISYETSIDYPATGRHWLTVNYTPDIDDHKKVKGIFVSAYDITDRKKKEAELAAAQQVYRELFENVNVGILRTTPGPKGTFIDVNPAMTRMFEADSREQLMALHPSEIYWDAGQRRIISDAIVAGGFAKEEIRFKTLKGRPIWCRITAVKKIDANGQVYFDNTIEDITERKLAEEKIRKLNEELEQKVIERTASLESANKELIKEITERQRIAETLQMHEAIIENSDDAIYGKDLQGIITSWNKGAERIYGYSSHETIGQPVSMLVPPDMPDDFHTILSKIANGEHIVHYETKRRKKDSQIIEVSVSISPIRNQSGKIIGASTIARDITERKRTEESINKLNAQLENNVQQLEAANKELEAFSYSVSHDLRAPLRAIDGFSKVLMESNTNNIDGEAKRYLNIIRGNTQNMGKLIDDLLSFSRIGKQEMHFSQISMESMARNTFEELKQQNPGRKIEFTLKKTPDASVDAAMMKIVLSNLLGNAVKYTGKRTDAVILFGGSIKNNEAVYSVKDNGVGFDMRYVGKLFGVFQRLHSRDEFEGTGVGLALVQRIILRHGGRVWAEGKVDEGAEFYFTLPIKKEEINDY